ncbi:fatty acid-binding protein, liver-type-like [Denticeps clupeoides]|uniref:fatty acid-binding protein, liver-type-like n=1 Tax=Denticeps clupeoides TaxID=299321 RepID=UPI0010A2D2EA|nr:fatty acid-binding protein, liver-type-like [Denticeps clupeoides]
MNTMTMFELKDANRWLVAVPSGAPYGGRALREYGVDGLLLRAIPSLCQRSVSLVRIASSLSDDAIEKGKDLKSITEIKQDGDHFRVTVTTGPQVLVNEFTVGKDSEIQSHAGEKAKAVAVLAGNKLIVTANDVESVTELVDADTIRNTLTMAGVSYKRISKRVEN